MKSVKYLFLETGNSLSPGRGGGWVRKVLGGSHGFLVGTDIAKEEYKGGAVQNC